MPSLAPAAAAIAGLIAGMSSTGSPPQEPAPATPCVAVVAPAVTGADSARRMSDAVSDLFVNYLNGPALQAITLEARLPAQAIVEARQRGCGRVLVTSVVRRRSSGSGASKVMSEAAGAAVRHTPYRYGAGSAAARGAAVATAQSVSRLAAETSKQDEMALEYRIGAPDTVLAAGPKTVKAKARANGEDLLTPLVERVSNDVFSAVTKGAP